MAKCLLTCLLIGVLIRTNEPSTEEASSSVLFTAMGQVTLLTAYGHLLVPLNIPSLKKAFDYYANLQSAINKLISSNTDSYNHLQSELKTLRSKLDIIHHLALTKRKDTHFLGVDSLNEFKDKIIANLGTKSNAWKSATKSTMAAPTSGGR